MNDNDEQLQRKRNNFNRFIVFLALWLPYVAFMGYGADHITPLVFGKIIFLSHPLLFLIVIYAIMIKLKK